MCALLFYTNEFYITVSNFDPPPLVKRMCLVSRSKTVTIQFLSVICIEGIKLLSTSSSISSRISLCIRPFVYLSTVVSVSYHYANSSKCVYLVQVDIIISLKYNSPWHNRNIAEVVLRNNHSLILFRNCRGRDHMVAGLTANYAISNQEFE